MAYGAGAQIDNDPIKSREAIVGGVPGRLREHSDNATDGSASRRTGGIAIASDEQKAKDRESKRRSKAKMRMTLRLRQRNGVFAAQC